MVYDPYMFFYIGTKAEHCKGRVHFNLKKMDGFAALAMTVF